MKFRKVFSTTLILLLTAPVYSGSVGLDDLFRPAAMLGCVNIRIEGVCTKGIKPGIQVTHWRPELIVETVKRPGESLLPAVGETVSGISQAALQALAGALVTSGSSSSYGPQSNLQFSEAHVYDYPFKHLFTPLLPFWCEEAPVDPGAAAFIKYLSELDFLEWRFGVMETVAYPEIALNISCLVPAGNPLCMGFWGPIYPRTGALIHQSEVVGSAGNVFRAVSNASLYGRNNHRVRISPLWWRPSREDKLQMFYPGVSRCIGIGENPALWETGKTSPSGKYLWVYWRKVTCCL